MRILRTVLITAVTLFGVAYLGAWLSLPKGADPASFALLADQYDVRLIRDDYGVPHLYGKRNADVAFGLGYAQAEDDFTTLQDVVLLVRGKAGTQHGADGAKTDYLVRMMRVWDAVDEKYETEVSAEAKVVAQAYADGVNFYASEHPGGISPYLLPVTGRDIVAGFTFKTPMFYGFDQALAAVFEGRYGTGLDKVEGLTPTQAPQPDIGSQGIAVAPSRSDDGVTRLLINSHQPLTGPVAWYEARLKSEEGIDMLGSTFPGAPLILHGHGPTLGWASTVNKPDLVDVYELEINPENPNQYSFDGAWREFETEDAPITVHFFGPLRWTFQEKVRFSLHGPVVETEKGAFALRWAGMGEVGTLDFFLKLNTARTRGDFEAALARKAMPSINYVYADAGGNIAHYYNAMMPVRETGTDWSGLVPGDRPELVWQGYYDAQSLPRTVNPPSGFVYNANNTPYEASVGAGQPLPADFDASMGIETQMTNRAYRIRRLFGDDPQVSREEFRAYKYDKVYDPLSEPVQMVRELLSRDLSGLVARKPAAAAAIELLKSWDFSTDLENRAAALGVLTVKPAIMARMNGKPAPDIEASFAAAIDLLSQTYGRLDVVWGDINRLGRGARSWPLAGGPDVLRAVYGTYDSRLKALKDTVGDSYIMFVEWDRDGQVSSRTVHSFGAMTEDRASVHYDDQAPLFAAETERASRWSLSELEQVKTSDRQL